MYASHFGLHRPPFNNTPDPAFYYGTPDHEEALATLEYATIERKGFVLVSGEVGAGKTLIGRMFLRRIEAQAQTAIITHTHLSGSQLLAAICAEFELNPPPQANNLELTQLLQNYLLEQFARDRSVVVLLDEAQNLPDDSFEELRMLSNLEADDAKLLQVCFLGQPELRQRFAQPSMKQLRQRLFRSFHLPALSLEQTAEYINHRLRVAGFRRDGLFTPEAIARVFKAANGIPRVINQICDNALLAAYAQEADVADERVVQEVLERDGQITAGQLASSPELRGAVVASSPAPAVSPNARADRRIEQIYGRAPETTQAATSEDAAAGPASDTVAPAAVAQTAQLGGRMVDVGPGLPAASTDAAQVATHLDRLQRAVARATGQWRAMKRKMESHEEYITSAIEDITNRCRSTQDQIEAVSRSSVAVDDLEHIRRAHQAETQRVFDEISRQRQSFEQLMDATESRWSHTRRQLAELADRTVSDQGIAAIETRIDSKIHGMAERLDQYQQRITELVNAARQECDRTSQNLDALRESGEQKQSQITRLEAGLTQACLQLGEGLDNKAKRDDVDALRASNERAHDEISRGLRSRLVKVKRELREGLAATARTEQLQALRSEQTEEMERLADRLAKSERGIRSLSEHVTGRLAAAEEALGTLEHRSATAEDLDQLRGQQATAMSDLVARFADQTHSLKELHDALVKRCESSSAEQASRLAGLGQQIAGQAGELQELRGKLLKHFASLRQRLNDLVQNAVMRPEMEELREAQARQNADLLARVQSDHAAVQDMIEAVVERCRSTQGQLESVSAAKADAQTVDALRSRQAQDVAQLLQMLDEQRCQMKSQLDQVFSCWAQTQEQLQRVTSESARTETVEALRDQLGRDKEQITETIASQRRDLESQVADLSGSCQRLLERMNELPRDVALAEDLQVMQAEHTRQIRRFAENVASRNEQFRQTVRQLMSRLDQTHSQLESLAASAATAEHVEALCDRQQHFADSIMERIERQQHEQSEKAADLEESFARNMTSLGAELDEVRNRHRADVGSLAQAIDQTADRVATLEQAERPRPVRIKLSPEAGQALADLVQAAREERRHLRVELDQIRQIAGQAHAVAAEIPALVHQWQEAAGNVQRQSEQLRASAETARNVLAAMKQCTAGLNKRLGSQEWQSELERGRQVTRELEQATLAANAATEQVRHAARTACEQSNEAARAATEQVRHAARTACEQVNEAARAASNSVTSRLSAADKSIAALRSQSEQLTKKLGSAVEYRRQILAAIARNTADLADVIQPGRNGKPEADAGGPGAGGRVVSAVEWPRFRTHQVQAG